MAQKTPEQIIDRAAAQLSTHSNLLEILHNTGVVKVAPRWPLMAWELAYQSGKSLALEAAPVVTFTQETWRHPIYARYEELQVVVRNHKGVWVNQTQESQGE